MWKSLRIGAVLAIIALAALKLAQYTAARSELEKLSASLAPSIALKYADVSGALDGRVIVEKPSIEVLAGPAKGTRISAERATIEPQSIGWLLGRGLSGAGGIPKSLVVRFSGTSLSQADLDRLSAEGWFGAASWVPFESLGCATTTSLSSRDYSRMGLAAPRRDDEVRYSYDAAARSLRADLVSTHAPFATVTTHLELSSFEPAAWFGDTRSSDAQRIEQFSMTFADGGYFAKRNRFCAQVGGIDTKAFATRHLEAVRAFLAQRGITAGDEVERLYAKLVADGGSAELSSLPDATFVPADFSVYSPAELLRSLNVTLRRDTSPPILMRLAFAAPGETAAGQDEAIVEQGPPASADADDDNVSATASASVVVTPAETKSESVPLLSTAYAATVPPPAPRVEVPLLKTEPASATLATTPSFGRPLSDPRDAIEAIPASAPPPLAGTTAALVWRAPTIERLPPKTETPSAYLSIPAGALGEHVGEHVRLTTAGGKRVEGHLQQVEALDVVLTIRRDGGSAQVRIPRAGIREAGVRRASVD